jgi:hypothetical protein
MPGVTQRYESQLQNKSGPSLLSGHKRNDGNHISAKGTSKRGKRDTDCKVQRPDMDVRNSKNNINIMSWPPITAIRMGCIGIYIPPKKKKMGVELGMGQETFCQLNIACN